MKISLPLVFLFFKILYTVSFLELEKYKNEISMCYYLLKDAIESFFNNSTVKTKPSNLTEQYNFGTKRSKEVTV